MTRVRVGVDVGGTFTKAVAVELTGRSIVASVVVPTTHGAESGVAAGVVQAVAELAHQVGADNIDLVTHSTTQAVNALIEGDAAEVGVIGMGRRPDLSRVEKRTRLRDVEIAPGKRLRVQHAFFDVTDGLPTADVRATLARFRDAGVAAVCVAEAFTPDDPGNERAVAAIASELGLPVCTSTDLSGLYGLELRTITAALNASILPIAVSTAEFVAAGVERAGIAAPVMVMRSDGGATDLAGFSSAPVRTLYSGPSASVAGALRYTCVTDAVVLEVGGTSTNVAAIRNGRPSLSYVRVASHSTALRSIDVRVVGVAGGSMARVRRGRLYGIGPRSAHIAGLRYASLMPVSAFEGATVSLVAPRPGDPADYVAIRSADGERMALTTTCAANFFGVAEPSDYCYADRAAARAAFEVLARATKLDADTLAERMLIAASDEVCELALGVAASAKLESPTLVGVGGGAGGLARYVARRLGWPLEIPDHAEVISSIGDALSLVRAERERTVANASLDVLEAMMSEVEAEVVAAGASPASVEIRVEEVPERSTLRAVAVGSVGLTAGATPGRTEVDLEGLRASAGDATNITRAGRFWLLHRGDEIEVLDRYGDEAIRMRAEVVGEDELATAVERLTRYRGPITLRPTMWIIDDRRLLEIGVEPGSANRYAGRPDVTYIVGRQR
jgi:N-methylhydantoinase A/oxoprolinase/acetone carboxylase beta subunit